MSILFSLIDRLTFDSIEGDPLLLPVPRQRQELCLQTLSPQNRRSSIWSETAAETSSHFCLLAVSPPARDTQQYGQAARSSADAFHK